jgi:hypothetical protein
MRVHVDWSLPDIRMLLIRHAEKTIVQESVFGVT